MKRIIYLISLSILAICCAKEANVNESSNNDEQVVTTSSVGIKSITFTASVESDPTTAGSMSAGVFTWSNTDEIAVYTNKGNRKTATAANISGSTADFSFTLDEDESIPTGAVVVYPSSFLTAAGTVTFPHEYTAADAAKSNLAIAAEVKGSSLNFKYLGAVIEATITDVPSIATAIEVTSTAALTGAHTVSFTEGVPTMSPSATGDKVTITPSAGSNTIVLPLPSAANDADETKDQSITYTVKYGSDELFTKTASKDVDRSEYFKMIDLTINPTVRFVGSLTSWDTPANYADAKLSGATSSRSITLTANGTSTYYYYLVEYPGNGAAVSYEMRPSSDGSTSAMSGTETMQERNNNASLVNSYGRYTFTFDYTTASNTVIAASSSDINIYLVGSFQSWALNNDTPLTMVNNHEGYSAMYVSAGSTFKAYTNPFWGSAFPGDNVTLETANYYLMVADAQAGTLQGVYANATSSSASTMTLKGNFDSWGSGLAMTAIDSSPFWYKDVDWASDTQFKFVKNGSTWMAYGDGSYATPISSQGWQDGNIKVNAGKYRIIASENDGRFAILARP